MSRPKCVTIYWSLMTATTSAATAVLLMAGVTIYSAFHDRLGAVGAVLLGWGILAAATACVASVSYLINKAVVAVLDDIALMLKAHSEGAPNSAETPSPAPRTIPAKLRGVNGSQELLPN